MGRLLEMSVPEAGINKAPYAPVCTTHRGLKLQKDVFKSKWGKVKYYDQYLNVFEHNEMFKIKFWW